MNEWQIGAIESRFADIIWKNEPIASGLLAKKSEEVLGWKKSTTYTVLKRLCDKGLFVNEGGTVSARVSREDFYSTRSEKFVEETFGGSLPAFLTAFTTNKRLSAEEIAQLKQIVDRYEEG